MTAYPFVLIDKKNKLKKIHMVKMFKEQKIIEESKKLLLKLKKI